MTSRSIYIILMNSFLKRFYSKDDLMQLSFVIVNIEIVVHVKKLSFLNPN